jgi:ADP-ribose pyrophosphatase
MKLLSLKKVRDGRYLKNYELTYENKAGRNKVYEIVSRKELHDTADLGRSTSGVSIIAFQGDKMLLLKEFRMGINKSVYNLCAGMLNEGESMEDCIRRELYEETGLSVKKIVQILPPSYSAVAISDVKTNIVIVEAEGAITGGHTSANEQIQAAFYTKTQLREMLQTEEFSSRSQLAAYFFVNK